MSQSVPFSKQRISLHPNNQPSGNKYTATTFPQINFVIARQPAMLLPGTLRLNGTFNLLNNNNNPVNIPSLASSATNGASLNNRIGISSVLEEVSISTLNGRNLETVRNYNRYLASSKPIMNNMFDYNNGLNLEDPFLSSKSVSNSRVANVETQFSIPIEVGMLGDQPINISEKGFHGLQLNLLLAQNATVSQPYFNYLLGSTPQISLATDLYDYELKNVFLTFEVIKPPPEFFNKLPSSGLLSFNTISTLHSNIQSSDTTVNLRLGCNNAISTTHTLIPAVHANNRNVDSFRLCEPETNVTTTQKGIQAKIRTVQYMRAGQLFPYNFVLDSENQGVEGVPQTMIQEPALNSISLYDNKHISFNPMSNVSINTKSAFAGSDVGLPKPVANDPESIFVLGVPMDSTKQGVSFRDREYAIRIQSGLDDTTANTLNTFVRCRNVAEYSPTGINVLE